MSVSLLQSPQLYTPNDNPIIWKFSGVTSTGQTIVYFKTEILTTGNTTIFTGNFFPTPSSPTSITMNVNKMLQPTVTTTVDNDLNNYLLSKPNNLFNYKLKVTDYGVTTGSTILPLSSGYTGSTFSVINGSLDVINYNSYKSSGYTMNTGLTSSFLTLQPENKKVTNTSMEQLYFINGNQNTFKIKFTGYNVNGTTGSTNTQTFTGVTPNSIYRINTAPESLIYKNISSGFSFVDGCSYSIEVMNGSSTISKTKTYKYYDLPCSIEVMNICWVNSLGGVDSYQFIQPQSTIDSTRLNIIKNSLVDGSYLTNNVYNNEESIYSNQPQQTINAWTQDLSDEESIWLSELVKSKQIFMELTDETLVPVTLVNTSYNIQRKKYTSGLNQLQFSFKLNNNFLPNPIY